MSNIPSDQWKDGLKDVLARAASDADFRAKCLADPKGALREAGVEVPAGTPIAFSETPDGSAITLPGFLSNADEILDEELLENVSGGSSPGSNYTNSPNPNRPCC